MSKEEIKQGDRPGIRLINWCRQYNKRMRRHDNILKRLRSNVAKIIK